MPVIGIPVAELTGRIRRPLGRDELLRLLEQMGCDVEGYEVLERVRCARCSFVMELVGKEEAPPRCDRCDSDLRADRALATMPGIEVVRMELLAVRPDLFDPGGLARAVRGILGEEEGLAGYAVDPPRLTVRVDDSVRRDRSLRPFIACAVLEEVRLDEDRVKILMKLQENLHWALGRDRKHASIGVYDLDALDLPASGAESGTAALEYTTEDPGYAFVPLGAAGPGPEHQRSLRRILEEHPKGVAYAHLLQPFDRYPILRTHDGTVLSMPPVINSDPTKVHTGSRRLFIDVTGTGRRIVGRMLNILVTSLLELDRSIRLQAVRIVNASTDDASAGGVEEITPDLRPQDAVCHASYASRLIGIPLDTARLAELLGRMRHGIAREDGDVLHVQVPAYRNDILHECDLAEDAAIAFGYRNIPRVMVPTMTVGRERDIERRTEQLRQVLIGLGFVEILGLVLTSPEQSDLMLGRADHPERTQLANPISLDQTQLRTSLLPGLLWTLARNRHNPLPQQVFEVGDVTFVDASAETGARERRHAAFACISPKAGFADARALGEALVRELGWSLRLAPSDPGFLLPGRGARIIAPEGTEAGVLGEVHPRVLEHLGLQNPAVVCEIALPDASGPQPLLSFP